MEDPRAGLHAPPAPPAGSSLDVSTLRAGLDAAGFAGAAVRAALGAETELLSQAFDVAVHERRLAGAPAPLAALIRLFVLDLPIEADTADRALEAVGAELLVRLGLAAEKGGALHACARIVPHDELLVVSDLVTQTSPEHVAGVHRPSATLANLTVRRQVERALDMGTGNGIQAILAAAHARQVVATDVNERALAFAEFNAALNDVTNVELRAGSFFEPVAGEQFELVVCNPPYVISPETAHVFRDSGLPGDTVSERLVEALPGHLVDGGFGTIMISWIAGDGDPASRPRSWLEGRGCDAWILHTATEDPLRAAASWNRTGGPSGDDAYGERLDTWLEYYAGLGIDGIAYGAAVLHRRSAGGGNWTRSAELAAGRLNPASAHLQQLFAAQELLREAPAEALLDVRLGLVEAARLDRTERVVDAEWVLASAALRLEAGIGFGVNLDRFGAAVAARLDGRTPVREHMPALAAELRLPERDLTVFATELLEHLVAHGFAVRVA